MGSQDKYRTLGLKILALGVFLGILATLFSIGGYHAAGSPVFCMSCHSMEDVGFQWQRSQHKQFACIECHLPDSNIALQIAYKAKAGMRDLYHETLRDYPAWIDISAEGKEIAEGNCMRCHFSTIEKTPMVDQGGGGCLTCHRGLVHGTGKETGGIKVE